jgi:hypothetical protein
MVMNTQQKTYKYIKWISPQEMHEVSLSWFSELSFARDEQLFLNDLVKSYTLQLTDTDVFDESRRIITAISKAEKEVVLLLKKVQAHENQLEIMVDDIDQPKMERAYRDTHRDLLMEIDGYLREYRSLKSSLFRLISKVMKKEKRKRLLN